MRLSVRLSAPVMAAALAFGGLAVAVAPTAAAACGAYGEPACPTVTIPAGQTNPDTRVVPVPGVVVVPQSVADRTTVNEERSLGTRRLAVSRATDVDRGTVFRPSMDGLRVRTLFTVRLESPSGDIVDFGSIRSDEVGSLTLPAIRYTARGTYVWSFDRAGGPRRFFAVSVS